MNQEMNYVKIKSLCQFCLKEQTKSTSKIPIDRQLKQNFFVFTQKKVEIVIFQFSLNLNKFNFSSTHQSSMSLSAVSRVFRSSSLFWPIVMFF